MAISKRTFILHSAESTDSPRLGSWRYTFPAPHLKALHCSERNCRALWWRELASSSRRKARQLIHSSPWSWNNRPHSGYRIHLQCPGKSPHRIPFELPERVRMPLADRLPNIDRRDVRPDRDGQRHVLPHAGVTL